MNKQVLDLFQQLKQLEARLYLQDGNLKLEIKEELMTPSIGEAIREQKPAIVEFLAQVPALRAQAIPTIPLAPSYRISDAQRRLWVLSQFEGGSAAYNMPLSQEIEIADLPSFEKAIAAVIDRHEILRTVFRENEQGEVMQLIIPPNELNYAIEHFDFRGSDKMATAVEQHIAEDAHRIFDLAKGPLFRIHLLQTAEKGYTFYFNLHHIISDGWSLDVLIKDVQYFYQAFTTNDKVNIDPLPIQYKEYAAWQLDQLTTPTFQGHKEYWLQKLQGDLPTITLPFSASRPQVKTYNGKSLGTYLSVESSRQLKQFIAGEGGSLFIALLANLKALLHRYTGEKDLIIGTPVAGRDHSDLENQIGFYVNTLALRSQISSESSFRQFYRELQKRTITDFNHQMYPFDRLVEELELPYNTSRNVIFDIMLVMKNKEATEHSVAQEFDASSIQNNGSFQAKFDLMLLGADKGEQIYLDVNYNSDLFAKEKMEMFINHFKQFLEATLKDPDQKIAHVDYLSLKEKGQLLFGFNQTQKFYPQGQNLVSLFTQQATRTPKAIALVCADRERSYEWLNIASNQLAHYLLAEFEFGNHELVGVQLERDEWLLVAFLAVLKMGAAYVPLDINYPEERNKYIMADSGCRCVINTAVLKRFQQKQSAVSSDKLDRRIEASDLAYVIYTSGSTGEPKGVTINHSNATELIYWAQDEFASAKFDIVHAGTSHCFDLSIFELFFPLSLGKSIRLLNNSFEITDFLTRDKNILINTVPSVMRKILEAGHSLKNVNLVNLAGEALPVDIAQQLVAKKLEVRNLYGPSEDTTYSTCYKITAAAYQSIPIGKPIGNTRAYILDAHLQPVAPGIIGQLYLSGAGLSGGYLHRLELTAEKFITNPFVIGERMYATGDLAKWMPDGNIEFVGRADTQIKLRGYRIELGEIEMQLNNMAEVVQAIVLAKADDKGEPQLVAYLTLKNDLDTEVLRTRMLAILPAYMVPNHFITLTDFPLNPNGKIDKKALPEISGMNLNAGEIYETPKSVEEKILAEVWASVLKKSNIGLNTNFYNLGGDSIKSIQVISRLRQKGFTLKVDQVLRNPILGRLAKYVQKGVREVDQSIVIGEVALTPIQFDLFHSPNIQVPQHYNQSVMLSSAEPIDLPILKACLQTLVEHHDALRLRFRQDSNKNWLANNEGISGKCFEVTTFNIKNEKTELELINEIGQALQANFNLENGPLLKVAHFKLTKGERLAIVLHHLVVDGVSWRILLEDLSNLYTAKKAGLPAILPPKTDSFLRWSKLLKEHAQSEKSTEEKAYWQSVNEQKVKRLKHRSSRDAIIKYNASSTFSLSKELTSILQTKVQSVYRTEINDVLLAALSLAVREVFGTSKVVLQMEGHGRQDILEEIDISRTVGWFTIKYPFVLEAVETRNPTSTLVAVKEALRKIPNKGIGFGLLKNNKEVAGNKIIPDIEFNYLGDFGESAGSDASAFEYANENIGENVSPKNGAETILGISGIQVAGRLEMAIQYAKKNFAADTINAFAQAYQNKLELLINDLAKERKQYLTPSDLGYKGLRIEELAVINADNRLENCYKMAPLQEGLYYHWLSEKSNEVYFGQFTYRVNSPDLQVEHLRKAYAQLVERHAVLRTTFNNEYGLPLQMVWKNVDLNFQQLTIDGNYSSDQISNLLESIKKKDRLQGFDLTNEPPMRLQVVALDEDTFEFIWSHHHILMDGWCIGILINDFYALYVAVKNNQSVQLPEVIPYANYISWLDQIEPAVSKKYWQDYLLGFDAVAELPGRKNLVTSEEYRAGYASVQIKEEQFVKLQRLCNSIGITQNTFIQAVWGTLLAKYNNSSDVVFGAVVAGRPAELAGIESMVGLFINMIPVRVQFDSVDTPRQLLTKLQQESISGNNHHYISLADIQAQSEVKQELINHILEFQNFPIDQMIEEKMDSRDKEEPMQISSSESYEQTNFDFNIVATPAANQLELIFKYNKNKFEQDRMLLLAQHFSILVEAFIEEADYPLIALEYLSKSEKQELIVNRNDTIVSMPANKTFLDHFAEMVKQHPNREAVVFKDAGLTYLQLDQQSNQLAAALAAQGLGKGNRVVLHLDRGIQYLVAMLAVMRSGACFIPINPREAHARNQRILNEASADLVIINKAAATNYSTLDAEGNKHVVYEEMMKLPITQEKININIGDNDLAYIIFTSGSTGKPKGAMVEHQGMINHLLAKQIDFAIDQNSVVAQNATQTFDVSVWQYLVALIAGGKAAVLVDEDAWEPQALFEAVAKFSITILESVPSHFSILLESLAVTRQLATLSSLRFLIMNGEGLPVEYCKKWFDFYPQIPMANVYGPTECSDDITHFIFEKCAEDWQGYVPIGQAIQNMNLYILDKNLQLLPQGQVGELYASGKGVGRGYLNNEEQTKQSFIKNPFARQDGFQMLYKTGDLVRLRADDEIEFLGRIDSQLKIRGNRVELGDIEFQLLTEEHIAQAVVVPIAIGDNSKELVAYYTAAKPLAIAALRNFLQERLPKYMVPIYFMQLAELPLTPNGKVDRKVLPLPEQLNTEKTAEYVAPRNATEERLVAIWENILQRSEIGIQDDLFELGAHSIKVIQFISRVVHEFDIRLSIQNIFNTPTISGIALEMNFLLQQSKLLEEDVVEIEI